MRKTLLILVPCALAALAVTIATNYVDNSRTGANTAETVLAPSMTFRKLGLYGVDGPVFAQPLFIPSVTIGATTYDLLVTATLAGTAYAFDANNIASSPLWSTHLSDPRVTYPDGGGLYHNPVGCLSTPVVDVANSNVFVSCTNNIPTHVLYKLSLTTGTVVSSVVMTTTATGTGDPIGGDRAGGGVVTFYPNFEAQRPGLTLANGNVYVAFGSYADTRPWHGWIMAYRTSDLTQVGSFCTTPNSYGGAIWQSGGGLAGGLTVDAGGNIYTATGNGTYDGATNFGDTLLKLSPTLALVDWFTPSTQANLEAVDADVSSGRPMIIPGTTQVVFGVKDFNVYSIDSTCMGKLGGTVGGCVPQIFPTNASGVAGPGTGIYGGMFLNGIGYFPNVGGKVYGFNIAGSTWNATPTATTSASFVFPGLQMSGSCNGTSNCIVWGISFNSNPLTSAATGTLRAFNPSTLAEIWNSDTTASDSLGTPTKFAPPTVANGKVFVATVDGKIAVYGITSASSLTGQASISGQAVIQ